RRWPAGCSSLAGSSAGRRTARSRSRRSGSRSCEPSSGSSSDSALFLKRGETPLEEAPLCFRVHERERAFVRRAGVVDPAQAAEQVGAGGVEVVVLVELEPVGDLERRLDLAGFREGRGAVQLRDG